MAGDLILVGRTGNGKSSTGNSILKKKTFKARGSSTPTIDDVIQDTATIDGQTVTVVDGPSFGDDSLDTPQHVQSTLKMAEKAMSLGSHGFSAVVIVLKYGIRYTKQESDAINAIKSFFGKDVVKKYGIIVWTHGDSFEMDTEDEDTSFEAWCRDQTGNIADLLQECEYRCVLFNNKSKDEDKVKAQYSSLMDMVDKIQTGPYTEDNFRLAEPDRRAILVRSKFPELESKIRELLHRINSQQEQMGSFGYQRDKADILKDLEELKTELKQRRSDLEKEDGGTKELDSLLTKLQVAEQTVDAKMRLIREENQVPQKNMAAQLLLVGRTGNGKSSTGNSILGKKLFKARGSSTPTIDDVIQDTATIDGQTVTVVDGPSFGDDSLDTPQHVQSTLKMAEKAMSLGSHGFSAVVIVLKYGIRYTKQESDVINAIKSFFGKDVVKKYGVIVWTHGDSFELDTEDEGTSFEAWCRDQTGNIADLLQECEYRCVLFNNKSKDEDKVKAQYSSLMDMVDKIQAGPYTEDNFRLAEPDRRAILVRSKLPELESETRQFLDGINSQLESVSSVGLQEDGHAKSNSLEEMKNDLENRRRYLDKEDGGTNELKPLFLELKVLEKTVDTKMRLLSMKQAAVEEKTSQLRPERKSSPDQHQRDSGKHSMHIEERSSGNERVSKGDERFSRGDERLSGGEKHRDRNDQFDKACDEPRWGYRRVSPDIQYQSETKQVGRGKQNLRNKEEEKYASKSKKKEKKTKDEKKAKGEKKTKGEEKAKGEKKAKDETSNTESKKRKSPWFSCLSPKTKE